MLVSPFVARLFGAIGLCSVALAVTADRFERLFPLAEDFGAGNWAYGFMMVMGVMNLVTNSRVAPHAEQAKDWNVLRLLLDLLLIVALVCLVFIAFPREREGPVFGIELDTLAIVCATIVGLSALILLVFPDRGGKPAWGFSPRP